MPRDVFISYKTEDKEVAERLCAALERENIACWIAPRDIPPGKAWAAAIVEGIQTSKSFVLLLSSHSSAAKQISREAELADTQNIPIVTFRIEDVQPPNDLLYFLGNLQWLDGFGGKFDSSAVRLADVIRGNTTAPVAPKPQASRIESVPVAPAAEVKRGNPYLVPGAAVLVVVIAVAAWLIWRGDGSAKQADDGKTSAVTEASNLQQAKATADRLLSERDSGNYEGAWEEYTPAFRNHEKRASWQETNEKLRASRGGVAEHQFQGCQSSGGQNGYICNYVLVFKNGSRVHDEFWLVRNDSGGWSVNKGRLSE
jgi:TIR domain